MIDIAKKSIIVCGIVRDAEKGLRRNIPVVNALCRSFASYKIVVFENDSKDGTKKLLKEWMDGDPENILVSMCDKYGVKTIPDRAPRPGVNRFFCRARIAKMADLRNQYMQYIAQQHLSADYLVVVDMDVAQLYLKPILDVFREDREWDAVSAYGYSLSPLLRRRYHDTYALCVLENKHKPQTEHIIFKANRYLDGIRPSHDWVRVASAFGGLTIYSFDAVRDIRYEVLDNADPRVEVYCEHYSIYRQMESKGHDKFFVVPSMVLKYQEVDFNVVRQFLKRIYGKILQHKV